MDLQIKCYMQQLFRELEHCHSCGVLHHYGVAVDLWSAGCILAELYARKPIMPGRTETSSLFYDKNIRVNNIRKYIDHLGSTFKSLSFDHVEQLHRIFKLCGSPSDEYWEKTKLSHATIFLDHVPHCVYLEENN
ncbi:hypothetical protein CsSME_00005698 [Camellia sinensis var. sinensis]